MSRPNKRLAQMLRLSQAGKFLNFTWMIMKVLIGYNGTRIPNDALGGLEHAGLPEDVEVSILRVSEDEPESAPDSNNEAMLRTDNATDRLAERFRFRNIKVETCSGSPSREILNRAKSFVPDLIVLGEKTWDDGEIRQQSVSQEILMEARCSVRIARNKHGRDDASPPRIVIGYDGSPGGLSAVEAVLARTWPANTTVRLVVVTDSSVLSSIGRFSPQMTNPKIASQWAHTLAEAPLKRLKDSDLDAVLWVESGCPKQVLLEVAESWDADSIFLGPHCLKNPVQQVTLGSVSAGVAARAPCSVEVVRTPALI